MAKKQSLASKKVERAVHEMKRGQLHSGSKAGPKVRSRRQAVAIALDQARREKRLKGAKV
jgi:hypothetical protein